VTDLVRNRPLMSGFAAIVLLFLVVAAFPIISETKQAVVVQFGKPARVLGTTRAGINYRIPLFEQLVWIDKRVQSVDMDRQQVLSTDQRRLEVDAFARYRIVNPLLMYIRAGDEERLRKALVPILGSEIRNELGKQPFAALLSPERQGVMENVRQSLDRVAAQYGARIIDVRIKKADLPDGSPRDAAFDRMRTAREQEARSILAEGAKRAQIIRAQADADAAKIYAASFGKDPDFYEFYRAMQSYQITFLGDDPNNPPEGTNINLSPDNDYLKEFTGRGR
jgi:membrane protease subunit HflC